MLEVNFRESSSALKNSTKCPHGGRIKDSKTLFPRCFSLGLVVLDSFLICRAARWRLFQQAASLHALR